ncbi:hypothetical protein WOLCODRAFT_139733 [Wolfiporia cocos MD-104 SS10]|uniref:Uncharacterized protein n=1 Tax=Wolfiporia cocos (strain MD-104) TaxID=742152 RepID=A0A2H3IYQ0_WOLCO|nr:hypothetical protein WOLCODRAFT_139733 [Wolfiporia cocos MD-104 SS10]
MWGDVFSIHDDFNDLKIDIDHLEYYLSNPECTDEQSHTRQEQEGRRRSRLRESFSASDLDDVEVRRITQDMVNLRPWSQLSPTHTRVKAIKSVAMKPPGPIAEMITVRCFN